MMSTSSLKDRRNVRRAAPDYLELVSEFPLRPLRTTAEYSKAAAMAEPLNIHIRNEVQPGVTAGTEGWGSAAALIPIGLSHIVYVKDTADLVPAWLPFRPVWAYLTGAAHIAAGLGVLFSVVPRLAATLEAAMIGLFTLLVWIPAIAAAPTTRLPWTAFFISWVIGAAAWLVADSIVRRES